MHQHQMQAAITQVSVRRQALAAHVAPTACHHSHDALEAPLRRVSSLLVLFSAQHDTLLGGVNSPASMLVVRMLKIVLCPTTCIC